MKAEITIKSQSDDEINSYFAAGDLSVTDDGFILSYILDEKDENRLVYNGKSVCQSRTGNLTYSVEFIEGQKCAFLFKEMGMSFSHEVNVHRVGVSSGDRGYEIEIVYSVSDGRHDEVTEIYVAATYKE